jgi:hypothetical protein
MKMVSHTSAILVAMGSNSMTDEIDLARGFEKIGNYHRSMQNVQNMLQSGTQAPGSNGGLGMVGLGMGMR